MKDDPQLRDQIASLVQMQNVIAQKETELAEIRRQESDLLGCICNRHGKGPYRRGDFTFRIVVTKDKQGDVCYRIRRPTEAVEV